MVVLRLLDFIIQAISVEVGAIGKLLWELIWALPSSIRDAFSTPWGAVGAALGGGLAWRRLRTRSQNDLRADDHAIMSPQSPGAGLISRRPLHSGEAVLAFGLVFLAVTVAARHAVMGNFLVMLPAPFAAALLAIGIIRTRDSSAPAGRQYAGFGLLLGGLGVLGVAAFLAASLSVKLALHVHRPIVPVPSLWEWTRFVGVCLIPALLIGPGLAFWTNWSSGRRIGWCVVILLFPSAMLILHRTLVAIGFLAVDA